MENKWLRSGGVTPASNEGEQESDKSTAVKVAIVIRGNEKSGIDTADSAHESLPTISENHGVTRGIQDNIQNKSSISPKSIIASDNNKDINEIIFMDPKRRRLTHKTEAQMKN